MHVYASKVLLRLSNLTALPLPYWNEYWWEYTTKSNLTGAMTVTATAVDLPGNMTELSQEKTIS